MAQYQILYWKHIPSQVRARDEEGEAKMLLPQRFQNAIDAQAMMSNESDAADYLQGWDWGPWQERPGSASEVCAQVVAELDAAMPRIPIERPGREAAG